MDSMTKILTVLGAVSAVATALHLAFEGCAAIWPETAWLKTASDQTGKVGLWLSKFLPSKESK